MSIILKPKLENFSPKNHIFSTPKNFQKFFDFCKNIFVAKNFLEIFFTNFTDISNFEKNLCINCNKKAREDQNFSIFHLKSRIFPVILGLFARNFRNFLAHDS